MSLPNTLSFSPFAILTAEEMNDLVENIEALQDWSAFDDGTLPGDLLEDGAVTSDKLKSTVAFKAYRNASWSFGSSVAKVLLDTEVFDEGSNFSLVNSNFVAPYDGIYHFTARSGGDDTSRRGQAFIYVNDVQIARGTSLIATFSGSLVAATVKLDANDVVDFRYQSDATDSGSTGVAETFMTGHMVGRV